MPRLHFIERLAAALVAIASLIALALGKRALAAGIGVGGMLAVANFYALRALLRGIITSRHPQQQALLAVVLTIKFAVMGLAIFVLINYAHIDPTGLLLGLTVVVVSILVGGYRVLMHGGAATQE